MPKKYRVTLTAEEREELDRLLSRGKADVRCLKHAQILLKADEAKGGPGLVGRAHYGRLRRRYGHHRATASTALCLLGGDLALDGMSVVGRGWSALTLARMS